MAAKNQDIDPKLLMYGGAFILLYAGVLKPITNFLGLTKSALDKEKEAQNDTAIKLAGWNPNFWKTFPAKTKRTLVQSSVNALAAKIHAAWGVFFGDDKTAMYAVFRTLQSQVQLSQLCDAYQTLYGKDLLTVLHHNHNLFEFNTGLNDADFNVIANIVNALPQNLTK